MSRPDEHWLGDPVLEPDWWHPLVLGAVAAAVLGAVVVTVVLSLRDPRAMGDGLVLATALLAVLPLLAVLVVSARRRPRGDAGQLLLRAGYHVPVLVPGAVVSGVLALLVGAVKPEGRYGLDYALGGAGLGLFAVGMVGAVVLLLVGASVRFPLANPGLPWHLRLSLPLVLTSMVVMAVGAALGVDPDVDLPRRLAGLVYALSGEAGVGSAAWLWAGRAGALCFVVGLALLAVALRDRRSVRLT